MSDLDRELQKRFAELAAEISANPNADGWLRLLELLRKAEKDKRVRSSPGASEFLELTIELTSDALTASTAEQAIDPLNDVLPLAIRGGKFTPKGRGPGPIRKRIEKVLAKDTTMKPRQVWDKIKSKPPAGWEFFDNSAGRYIEGPKGGQGMGYPRFSEVCKEVRDKLQS